METGVEIDAVLQALSRRIGEISVELEVAKLELLQAKELNSALGAQIQKMRTQLDRSESFMDIAGANGPTGP